jgi:tetratricopeptide (TPR) repeat protein
MAAAALPKRARIHVSLARLLEWLWPAGAAWAWADAVACAPGEAELHFLHGRGLARIGRWDQAVRALGRATHLDPASLEYQGALAIALDRAGRRGPLIDALKRFAHLCPGEGEPQLLVGVVLRRSGNAVQAMRAFRRAVQLSPALGSRRFVLGEAILGERGWQQALGDCEGARRADTPSTARTLSGRSVLNFHPVRQAPPRVRREPLPGRWRRGLHVLQALLAGAGSRWLRFAQEVQRRLARQKRLRAVRQAWRRTHEREAFAALRVGGTSR